MYTGKVNHGHRYRGDGDYILLTEVKKDGIEFRDHIWILVDSIPKELIPKFNKYKIDINFEAEEKDKYSIDKLTFKQIVAVKLVNITNVRKLK